LNNKFISNRPSLTFSDVLLVPQYSEVPSRTLVDTSTRLTKNKLCLKTPIISANMDTVTESNMAATMGRCGGSGVIHRFLTIEDQCNEIKKTKSTLLNDLKWYDSANKTINDRTGNVGAALGVKGDYIKRAEACANAGADYFVVDIAHGHSKAMENAFNNLMVYDIPIVAGNVATAEGARFLIELGADAVKVGIGPSGICSTRLVAGTGVPQLSAILDCSEVCDEFDVPLIADGGIKTSGDIAKAIAAGASSVMIGSLLAKTSDSPGELVEINGKRFKVYRGMASRKAMDIRRTVEVKEMNGSAPEPRFEHIAPEGIETLLPYEGDTDRTVNMLTAGLRSAMSYSNALDVPTFQENARFVQISSSGLAESQVYSSTETRK
jgi:IMP dehydrogenase/GMP reductase